MNYPERDAAFPLKEPTSYDAQGITIRDYFAAKAMPQIYQRALTGGFEHVAKLAYELADAMLKERDK